MAKVRFVADQTPTGIDGTLMLTVEDGKDKLREFLVQLRSKRQAEIKRATEEGRTPERYLLQVELGVSYRPRTMKQHNLQWELCSRIAKADHTDPDVVHEAMKQIVYPKEEHYGAFVPKDGEELTTVEYAGAIEWLIHECLDRPDPVDIHDIWVLFTTWRYQQERDPIDYITPESYREAHPCCEVCGKFLLEKNQEGEYHNTGQLAHIKGRGAGGPDYATWDVIMTCAAHHVGGAEGDPAIHQQGWEKIVAIAPWLKPKIDRALKRPTAPEAFAKVEVQELGDTARETAKMVKDIFRGTVVQGKIEDDPAPPPPDPAKEKMLNKLKGLGDKALARQQELYPPRDGE